MQSVGKGAGSLGSGIALLPITGQHTLLLIVAIAALLVGSAVLASSFFRYIAKRMYKA